VVYDGPQAPGPQAPNQIAATVREQLSRALGPQPDPLALDLARTFQTDGDLLVLALLQALAERPAACQALQELLARRAAA
jgi:hypothetical protein